MMKPEILQTPYIPNKVHTINPRSIMGKEWWDTVRKEAYQSTNYHCAACGVHTKEAKIHQRLEAHEIYDYDYDKFELTYTETAPLCHSCHMFIHSGLLSVWLHTKKMEKQLIQQILTHGVEILFNANLKMFLYTFLFCGDIGVDTKSIKTFSAPVSLSSDKWILNFNGKQYGNKN